MKSKSNEQLTKQRRVHRSRKKVLSFGKPYLSVHRTANHIYAQVFSAWGETVLASASSVDPSLRSQTLGPGKIKMAEAVGKLVAERACAKGINKTKISFDRSGYKYHGRIKALADSARANGLDF